MADAKLPVAFKAIVMKRIVLCWLLLAPLTMLLSQEPAQKAPLTKADYLQRSKEQRTFGWILVGAGTTAVVAGLIVGNSDDSQWFGPNFGTAATLFTGGLIADLASIPFFISAASNARKAATLSFRLTPLPIPGPGRTSGMRQPAVLLKIPLGK